MIWNLNDALFIGVWACVGSILGFFSFRDIPDKPTSYKIAQCCLSVCIGLFLAFPLSMYLFESEMFSFSKQLSIMLGGIGAFGLPDLILTHWKKLTSIAIVKLAGKAVNREND